MTISAENLGRAESMALTLQEQRLVKTLRLLQQIEPTAPEQTEQFVWSLVSRSLRWNYSDPESTERAQQFAALDPFLRREAEAVSEDVAPTGGDGLEDY